MVHIIIPVESKYSLGLSSVQTNGVLNTLDTSLRSRNFFGKYRLDKGTLTLLQ